MTQATEALITSRDLRERNAGRVDVLDKVKALALLPGDTWATSEIVADYYEVGIEAVRSVVKDNRDEIASDGYRVITGDELRSLKDFSGFQTRAPQLALFPRRAILRIGMLLRDSDVARAVRSHLLDAEQLPDMNTTDGQIAVLSQLLVIAQANKALELVNANQARELESARPRAAYVKDFVEPTEDVSKFSVIAAQLGLTEPKLRAYLVGRGVIKRKLIGQRWSRKKQRHEPEYEWLPKAAYLAWFVPKDQPEAPRLHNGQMKTTLYVTPVGKVGIENLLEAHPIGDDEPAED